jgi:hypothetical protein
VRQLIGRLLVPAGLVALVGGPAFGLFAGARLVKLPVDVSARQVSEGRGMYLDPERDFRVVGPVGLRSIHEVRGDPEAGSSSVAVWNAVDRTFDLDHDRLLPMTSTRYVLDRRSAAGVTCCGVKEQWDGSLLQTFPIGTERVTYRWWDGTAERVVEAKFDAESVVDDLKVYRFTVTVPPLIIDRLDLPREAVGEEGSGPIRLNWWYRSDTELLVEPATGVIVEGSQVAYQWLSDPAGRLKRTVAVTDLTDTPDTVARNVSMAEGYRRALDAVRLWPVLLGPLVAMGLFAAAAARPHRVGAAERRVRRAPVSATRPARQPIPAPGLTPQHALAAPARRPA